MNRPLAPNPVIKSVGPASHQRQGVITTNTELNLIAREAIIGPMQAVRSRMTQLQETNA